MPETIVFSRKIFMRLVKCLLAGPALAGILAMMPAAAFAQGGAVRVGEVENTLLSVVVTHLADSPVVALVRDSAERVDFLLVDFLVAKITAALVTVVSVTIVSFFNSLPGLFIGLPTILTITPTWITDRITTINLGTIQPRLCNRSPSDPPVDHGPVVVSINAGNSRPMDSRANTEYINSGYSSSDAAGQQRIGMQDPNEKLDREPIQGPSFLRRSGNRLRRLQKALRQGHKHRSGPW